MIKRLAHVCIHASDLNKTVDFYHGKIGLPIVFRFHREGVLMGVYFALGHQTYLEAFEKPDLEVVNTGISHFCLEVDDIDGFIREVTSHGVECTEKKLGCDQSWQTWLQDPDGNRFEIHQYTDASAQLNGGIVNVDW